MTSSEINGITFDTWLGLKESKLYLVDNKERWDVFFSLLMKQKIVACDTETSGFRWYKEHHIVGVSFGWDHTHFYIPFRHENSVLGGPVGSQLCISDVKEDLVSFFSQKDVKTLWHNFKFDAHFYNREGVKILTPFHDTMHLWQFYDENAPKALKIIATGWKDQLGQWRKGIVGPTASEKEKIISTWRAKEARARKAEFKKLVLAKVAELQYDPVYQAYNKAQLTKYVTDQVFTDHPYKDSTKQSIHYGFIPIPVMCEYAALDTFLTFELYRFCMAHIIWNKKLQGLYINELKLTKVLFDIEETGVCVDVDYLHKLGDNYSQEENQCLVEINKVFGNLNPNATKQVADVLIQKGVALTKTTEASTEDNITYSVDKEVLEEIQEEHPDVKLLLKLREITKLKDTYVYSILDKLVDGNVLHCNFNQNVATGRMSSSDPNLQNIPGSKSSSAIRKAFIPVNDDYVYVFIDYSQIEVRLTAHYSQDPLLLDAYVKQQDVHTRTMCEVFGKFYEEAQDVLGDESNPLFKLFKFLRNVSKTVNFAIIYGVGAPGLSTQIPRPPHQKELTKKEWIARCQQFIDDYLAKYLGVKRFVHKYSRMVKTTGQVENAFGRIRRLPHYRATKVLQDSSLFWMEAKAQRQGTNFVIQSTAADLFKLAVVRVAGILEGKKSKIVNLVHDEIQLYIHKSEISLLKEIKRVMEDFPQFSVPMVAEISYTRTNWGEKKELHKR